MGSRLFGVADDGRRARAVRDDLCSTSVYFVKLAFNAPATCPIDGCILDWWLNYFLPAQLRPRPLRDSVAHSAQTGATSGGVHRAAGRLSNAWVYNSVSDRMRTIGTSLSGQSSRSFCSLLVKALTFEDFAKTASESTLRLTRTLTLGT
jgi:hypothetical protein